MSLMSETLLLAPKYLTDHALFADWELTDLHGLLEQSMFMDYEAGELIFKRGEYSANFYIIERGQVQLQMTSPNGGVKKTSLMGSGDSIGDTYVLMATPYRVDALALNSVRVLKIDKDVFYALLLLKPKLASKLIATLSERLHHLLGDVLTTRIYSGTQRVIHYLLEDLPLRNGSKLILNSPKAHIAASLNLTPEHFSRILHDLSKQKFITVNGRQIVFLDIDGLCAYDR